MFSLSKSHSDAFIKSSAGTQQPTTPIAFFSLSRIAANLHSCPSSHLRQAKTGRINGIGLQTIPKPLCCCRPDPGGLQDKASHCHGEKQRPPFCCHYPPLIAHPPVDLNSRPIVLFTSASSAQLCSEIYTDGDFNTGLGSQSDGFDVDYNGVSLIARFLRI